MREICTCRHCGNQFVRMSYATKLYCNDTCRLRYFDRTNPKRVAYKRAAARAWYHANKDRWNAKRRERRAGVL